MALLRMLGHIGGTEVAWIAALLLLMAVVSPGAAEDTSLVLDCRLDEGSGAQLKDVSGHGNHGQIHGAKWIKMDRGHALEFDGTESYVDFGNSSSLDITGPITVEVWVCPTDIPTGEPGIFGKYIDSSFALTYYTNGRCYWYINHGSNGVSTPLPVGMWHHVTGTFDGKRVALFLDGTCQDTRESAFPSLHHGDHLFMGAVAANLRAIQNSPKDLAYFKGLIGAVRVYDRALSEPEIREHYYQEVKTYDQGPLSPAPPPDDVLARWKAETSQEVSPNLALASNGGRVVTSSNANLGNLYSENLHDESLRTPWRSYQPTREEWVEVAWDFEVLVNRAKLFQDPAKRSSALELYAWSKDTWQRIAGQKLSAAVKSPEGILLKTETVRTKRVRLVLKNDKPRHSWLHEIQVYGPPQPHVRLTCQGGQWKYLPLGQVTPRSGEPQVVRVDEAALSPATTKLQREVNLTLKLTPAEALTDDYVFVVTVGEREQSFASSDYTVARVILNPPTLPTRWEAGQPVTISVPLYIPVHAPHGSLDMMLHAVSPKGLPPVRFADASGAEMTDGRIGRVEIRRFPDRVVVDSRSHSASIDASNGTVISLDGRKTAPILFALYTPSFERFHYYSQAAGVKLYHLQVFPYRIDVGDYQKRNYEYVGQNVRNLLRIDPDAYAIIEVDMRTSAAWQEAHPDGCLYTHDGRRMHESFCAKEYREEATSYLTNLVKFFQSQPYGNHVVGYLVEIGEPEGVLSGSPAVGDYNPQAIEAFREFVRKRYGTEDRLRKAYNDPTLTFASVFPTHSKIMEPGYQGGIFLDPTTQRLTIDYHEFLSSLIPTFLIEHCARPIKELTNGRALVGSYWAYLTEDIAHGQASHQGNHSYLPHVFASPYLDFFASPFSYGTPARHAGEPYRTFQPHDSVRINGKLHIPECDHRTFRAGTVLHGRNFSREETLAIIRRDLGTALMRGMGAWFSDWTSNNSEDRRQSEPFFTDSQILGEIAKLRRKHEQTFDLKRGQDAEVAVFVSGTSYYYHDNNAQSLYTDLIYNTLYRKMPAIGAPYHELIFEDVLKPQVQKDYKCYIFLNAFYMTEEQRKAIENLKRDGKTLVWIYAPGYVGDRGLSPARTEELTGFKISADPAGQALTCKMTNAPHPICASMAGKEFGGDSGGIAPRFYVSETASQTAVLGNYPDGKAAFVAQDFRTHKSVYCAVPLLPTELLRNIVRYAGCHLYVDQDIYMDATRNFLMLTNTFAGARTCKVSLPVRSHVSDLFTGKPVAKATTGFEVKMEPGETMLFRVERILAR
ncbi:MAG: beta-galactosidase [Armatimonadetes bacterium]|nr:beta-galactosidase [Armatimonadota bacterium]